MKQHTSTLFLALFAITVQVTSGNTNVNVAMGETDLANLFAFLNPFMSMFQQGLFSLL